MKKRNKQELTGIANRSKASQDKVELIHFLYLLNEIEPKIIVEIGVHQGHSIQTWKEAFDPELLIGIENDPHDLRFKDFSLIHADSTDKRTLLKVIDMLNGRMIDFLFLDGDHTYKGVRKDWENYFPLVRKGGIAAIHDIARVEEGWKGLVETRPFFDLVKIDYPHEEIMHGGPGVGIVRKT